MKRLLLLVAIAGLTACSSTRFDNYPLSENKPNEERRTLDLTHKDRPTILVAISGGGSRAAALGYTILKELRETKYTEDGKQRSLADDVAVISSVSGGSVIAAYFGLYGPNGLDNFKSEFLEPDNMATLGADAINPFTWFNMIFGGLTKVDIVEKLFDEQLFHNKTFSELNQPGKPFVILNSTDMAGGELFAFTPSRFDDICSDLDKEPISVGVAASSAVPIVVSPVSFENYSKTHCHGQKIPQWISETLRSKYNPYLNINHYKWARYANDLRDGKNTFRNIDYIHLLDGGLADNLGVQSLMESISSPLGVGELLWHFNQDEIKKLVVLVVNARAEPVNSNYQSPDHPGVVDMAASVASVPIDSNTATVNSLLDILLNEFKKPNDINISLQNSLSTRLSQKNAQLEQLKKEAASPKEINTVAKDISLMETLKSNTNKDAELAELNAPKVYPVLIDFDQLRADDAKQKQLRDLVKGIPTLWTISKENNTAIEQAGRLLLHQHPCFQHLLMDMKINKPFIDNTLANICSP